MKPVEERNLDGYDTPAIPWEKVRPLLDGELPQAPGEGGPDRHTHWLATNGPGGRPHVVPLGVVGIGGRLYFNSGPGTRKSRDLERDPRCTVTVATHPFDLVVEGEAHVLRDPELYRRVAATFAEGGWPCRVEGDPPRLYADFSAPSAGPPPWDLYEVTPARVYAFGTAEPYGATRFDL